MKERYAVEIPEGNGYKGNARSILRIKQHLDGNPSWGATVRCEAGVPLLTPDGGFYLEEAGFLPLWGRIDRVLKQHYGTLSIRSLTKEEKALLP
jgi:hypothetical protein